jgi:hypothetical protein
MLLNRLFIKKHWMMLASSRSPAGGSWNLAFVCSLYGTSAYAVSLGEAVPTGLAGALVFVAVDYTNQTVKQFTLEQIVSMAGIHQIART